MIKKWDQFNESESTESVPMSSDLVMEITVPKLFVDVAKEEGVSEPDLVKYLRFYLQDVIFDEHDEYSIDEFRLAMKDEFDNIK